MDVELQKPGSLDRPGPIGRTARFGIGAFLLFFPLRILINYRYGDSVRANDPVLWFGIAISMWVIAEVVELGYRRDLGQWPRFIALIVIALGAASELLLRGSLLGDLLTLSLMALVVFVYGILGSSFVLAALFAVPG